MGLTTGGGPLSSHPSGYFTAPVAEGVGYVEPHRRRIQALRGDRIVIDTEEALLVHRPDRTLSYAFPAGVVDGLPTEAVPEAPGYVTVPWAAVDAWVEEGRRLVHYPPNPYHRVDCRPTRRHLRAAIGDVVLVDTDRTIIVFETGLPARLYVARSLVAMDLLEPSASSSYCNYKGTASYWSARVGDRLHEDVAWSYDDPLPESLPIQGCLSFDPGRLSVSAELPGEDSSSDAP